MRKKTKKVCQVCGKPFYRLADNFYCPECARQKKLDTVVKIRTCQDCGMEFFGGPRAKRCPDCAEEARRENSKRYRTEGTKRAIGSIDNCQWCGEEYIVVSGRQKYCSEKCQRMAVLAWQREHKKGYAKASGQNIKKQQRRDSSKKICVYCGRVFKSDKPTNVCSEYCRNEQKKLLQCESEQKRGHKCDIKKYIDRRTEYREKIKSEIDNINH